MDFDRLTSGRDLDVTAVIPVVHVLTREPSTIWGEVLDSAYKKVYSETMICVMSA